MAGQRRARATRWAVVAAVLAVLGALPAVARGLPSPPRSQESAAALLARIRASSTVAYDGYAEAHGTLAVPDVSQLGDLPALLGQTSKLRVWWAAPDQWRVDDIDDLGEQDSYGLPDALWQWDSQTERATFTEGTAPVRAPRAADLLPSALGERLAGTQGAAVTRLDSHDVAGHTAQGLRLTPAGPTTVAHVDIWADTASGLPLQVQVYAVGVSVPVLSTAFLTVRLGNQSALTTTFSPPPEAKVTRVSATTLNGLLGRLRPLDAPATLVGLPASQPLPGQGGIATYGTALGTIAVIALSHDDGDKLAGTLTSTGVEQDFPAALAIAETTSLVNALLVRGHHSTLLIAGTVPVATLRTAYTELGDDRVPYGEFTPQ